MRFFDGLEVGYEKKSRFKSDFNLFLIYFVKVIKKLELIKIEIDKN